MNMSMTYNVHMHCSCTIYINMAKREPWTYAQTRALMTLWREEQVQQQLKSMGCKASVWQETSEKLQNYLVVFSYPWQILGNSMKTLAHSLLSDLVAQLPEVEEGDQELIITDDILHCRCNKKCLYSWECTKFCSQPPWLHILVE